MTFNIREVVICTEGCLYCPSCDGGHGPGDDDCVTENCNRNLTAHQIKDRVPPNWNILLNLTGDNAIPMKDDEWFLNHKGRSKMMTKKLRAFSDALSTNPEYREELFKLYPMNCFGQTNQDQSTGGGPTSQNHSSASTQGNKSALDYSTPNRLSASSSSSSASTDPMVTSTMNTIANSTEESILIGKVKYYILEKVLKEFWELLES